jgi:hypothetical protein
VREIIRRVNPVAMGQGVRGTRARGQRDWSARTDPCRLAAQASSTSSVRCAPVRRGKPSSGVSASAALRFTFLKRSIMSHFRPRPFQPFGVVRNHRQTGAGGRVRLAASLFPIAQVAEWNAIPRRKFLLCQGWSAAQRFRSWYTARCAKLLGGHRLRVRIVISRSSIRP